MDPATTAKAKQASDTRLPLEKSGIESSTLDAAEKLSEAAAVLPGSENSRPAARFPGTTMAPVFVFDDASLKLTPKHKHFVNSNLNVILRLLRGYIDFFLDTDRRSKYLITELSPEKTTRISTFFSSMPDKVSLTVIKALIVNHISHVGLNDKKTVARTLFAASNKFFTIDIDRHVFDYLAVVNFFWDRIDHNMYVVLSMMAEEEERLRDYSERPKNFLLFKCE